MLLQGRVALITGAKGGLGTYVTNAFLRAGAVVAGVSRSIAASDFDHPNFHAIPGEVSSGNAARAVVEAILAKSGRLDAVVHLVGAYAGGARVDETSDESFEKMFDLNVRSAFQIIKAALAPMREQRSGRILAIGSRAAVEPQSGAAPYSAAKAALITLIRTVASENADMGITASIVLPGTMNTPANRTAMPGVDSSKWVDPCQVAELLVYLASDRASNVNGAAIPVYGSGL